MEIKKKRSWENENLPSSGIQNFSNDDQNRNNAQREPQKDKASNKDLNHGKKLDKEDEEIGEIL